MKKVRFLSNTMDGLDCHSPRPFIRKGLEDLKPVIPENNSVYPSMSKEVEDTLRMYETSNSTPYPLLNKTELSNPDWSFKSDVNIQPSDQLNISFLDSSYLEPRKPTFTKTSTMPPIVKSNSLDTYFVNDSPVLPRTAFKSIENSEHRNTQKSAKDNSFFIKPENIENILPPNSALLHSDLNKLNINKENEVLTKKAEMMKALTKPRSLQSKSAGHNPNQNHRVMPTGNCCKCPHCYVPPQQHHHTSHQQPVTNPGMQHNGCSTHNPVNMYPCVGNNICTGCPGSIPKAPVLPPCQCKIQSPVQHNTVENKTRALEKYEASRQSNSQEIEPVKALDKEKAEPTVADLFKIIKMQNEQLQLLQEKVDKFISSNQPPIQQNILPVQNFVSEKLTVKTLENNHQMSIGVMTSFEMCTSTVVNKEVVKANSVQIQCNRSQISTKEVLNRNKQPVMLNFLEGIEPVSKSPMNDMNKVNSLTNSDESLEEKLSPGKEKTLNEQSLYNVQVDNATTPQLSPEQTLYLDVRDYSDSDSTSDEQSHVGWTYYNKVMAHVNGILHDSDMPSSASALYRNTQQCLQMQIDKTNVSVVKRVKFGDDPLGLYQPTGQTTDTSMKMNQLATKYLSGPMQKKAPVSADMSFATRRYMERHQLLQGGVGVPPQPSPPPVPYEMPRFLDITALKQQPKFL